MESVLEPSCMYLRGVVGRSSGVELLGGVVGGGVESGLEASGVEFWGGVGGAVSSGLEALGGVQLWTVV